MSDLLDTGAAWLASKQKASVSRAITYSRGAQTLALTATLGRSEFQTEDASGALTAFETRDYIITAADFALLTSANEPQPGDLITDRTLTCEVTSPGPNIPAWNFCDGHYYQMRIHTKVIVK